MAGNASRYDDLEPFTAEQRLMEELVGASRLPSLEVDISDDDVPKAVETVADWLEADGLYLT